MIIFGFGHQKATSLGNIGAMDCPRCHNTAPYVIHRVRTYFSLFFIPLIPYSTKYLLSCTICREAREISEAEKDRLLHAAA